MSRDSRETDEPHEQQRAARDEHDVLPRDREQVVEPGRPEALPQVVREALVLAEDHAFHDGAPYSGQAAADDAREPAMECVRDPSQAAAPADEPPAVAAQHDVHAVPSKPRALVEAVGRSARKHELTDHLESSAERRRTAERELE